jgi:hypothetical protein
MRAQQPQPGGDQKARRDGADAAQHALQHGRMGIGQEHGSDREAYRPRHQDKPGQRHQRPGRAAEFGADANGDADHV